MNARIPTENPGMAELEALFATKLKAASTNGFMLGAHTSMRLAAERFGPDIRSAETFEELQKHALALLVYMDEKAEGLKNVAGGKIDDNTTV